MKSINSHVELLRACGISPAKGGSCIVSPFGDMLSGPAYRSEQILTTEIDLSDIVKGKFDLDVVGHYSRPDIFRLLVDEREQNSIEGGIFTGDSGLPRWDYSELNEGLGAIIVARRPENAA